MAFNFEESEKDLGKDLAVDVAWLIIWITAVTFGGFFSLTAGRALEEEINFAKFILFGVMMAIFAIFVIGIKLAQRFGKFQNVYIPIFDPEKGAFPIKSGLKFLLGTLLVLTLIGFATSFVPQSTFTNFIFPLQVGIAEQQVTTGGKILFGFYNSPAENAFLYLILAFIVTIEFVIFNGFFKFPRKWIFLIFMIPNILIGSFVWLEIHDLVSADDSRAQISNIVFGAELSASVLLTGTIIIPEVLHATNNAFIVMRQELSQTTVTIIFLLAVLILAVANVLVYTTLKPKQ